MSNLQFTFVDVEALWDEELYHAYRAVDPRGAAKIEREEKHLHRLPCKRIVAAAAFDIELADAGAISIGGLKAWTEHDYGGEKEVVTQLFEHLCGRPQTHVVTYGGLSAEIPLFNLAGIEHELILPPQLRTGQPVRFGAWRPHIDFALTMKGNGRDWAHMTEIGLRLGLPGELFAGKADIAEPRSSEEWEAMRHRVSTDCVLTSMIALAYWRANGHIMLDQSAALLTIADWCLRNRCLAEAHVEPLTRVRAEMFARLGAEWEAAA
jgi:hypothetical protein